jgi:hypothetical protein
MCWLFGGVSGVSIYLSVAHRLETKRGSHSQPPNRAIRRFIFGAYPGRVRPPVTTLVAGSYLLITCKQVLGVLQDFRWTASVLELARGLPPTPPSYGEDKPDVYSPCLDQLTRSPCAVSWIELQPMSRLSGSHLSATPMPSTSASSFAISS